MKLNGIHQLMVYVDDVNILVVIVGAIQENAKSLVVAGSGFGLEVNANKTKHMDRSRKQKTGRNHSKKFDNGSFERYEEFEYLETN